MGFTAMDGFFLAMFLAVCILVAIILRCICYRCCLHRCPPKFRHGQPILAPRTTPQPTITPARPHTYVQVENGTRQDRSYSVEGVTTNQLSPRSRALFTIYTFPQHDTIEVVEQSPPRTPGPPKYSSLPCDAPPSYEDLFPKDDFTLPTKTPAVTLSRPDAVRTPAPVPASAPQSTRTQAPTLSIPPVPAPPSYVPPTPPTPGLLPPPPTYLRSRSRSSSPAPGDVPPRYSE